MEEDEKQIGKNEIGKESKGRYKPMTDKEIKQLAEDMYKGLIFTDRHVQSPNDIQMVFMPLALIGKELLEELQKNPPGMIYEYIDRAGPMAVNGMPMFTSAKMASIDDTKKIFDQYHKIKEVVAKV